MRHVLSFAIVMALLTAVFAASPCRLALAGNPLLIASHPDFPPVMYEEDGRLMGIGPKLAVIIAEYLGLTAQETTGMSWGRTLASADTGQVDFIAGLYKTPDRERRFIFVPTPFIKVHEVLFTRANDGLPDLKTLDELKHYRLGLIKHERHTMEYETFLERYGDDLKTVHLASIDNALLMLTQNRIDCFLWDYNATILRAKQLGLAEQIKVIEPRLSSTGVYFAFSRLSSYRTLAPAVDRVLKKLIEDGTVSKLVTQEYDRFGVQRLP